MSRVCVDDGDDAGVDARADLRIEWEFREYSDTAKESFTSPTMHYFWQKPQSAKSAKCRRCARRRIRVRGFILADCCRYFEFVVRSIDASSERVNIDAEVVHSGRVRDFFGFNRAKHAVVEAAILATRLHLIPLKEVADEFAKLRVIVGKTGGPDEFAAMDLLERRLREAEARATR